MVTHTLDDLGLWELAVVSLLRERPMHPYEVQKILKARHKDDVLVLKRGSLYHAIGRLSAAGLIAEAATERDGARPERTVYRITPAGVGSLLASLNARLARPRRETSDFMGSLSFLVHVAPAEAALRLRERLATLTADVTAMAGSLAAARGRLQPIFLIENDYALAMKRAEQAWVAGALDAIESGRLTWDIDAILAFLAKAGEPK